MSVVSEIKKGSKKIKAAQLDRITDISGRYFAEYNSSTGECKNPVAEPITNIVITGNSTKVNADPDIPNDYIAIEYLESDGNQYVQFGFHSSDDVMKYNLKVNLLEQYVRRGIIGGDNVWFNGININKSEYLWADLRHPEVKITTEQPTGIVTLEATDNLLIVNGNNGISSPDTNDTFEDLWVRLPSTKDNIRKPIRVYKVEVENVGKWKVDCVPVIRKSDNKPGMYDKVSKQFFVNQGTGEFIVGPELPGKILEVDTLTKRGKNLYDNSIQTFTPLNKAKKATLNPNGTWTFEMQGLNDYFNEVGVDIYRPHNGCLYECEPDKTYYFNNNIGANLCYISFFDKDKKVCNPRYKNVHANESFTTPSDCVYLTVRIGFNGITGIQTGNYIITDHPTEQIYEPYQQPELISFDKDAGNMLNIPDQGPTTVNGITYTIKNGVITLNGTSTDAVILLLGDVIPTNSTYSFRVFNESKTFATNSIRFYSFCGDGSNVYNWVDYLGSKDAWTNTNYEVGLSRMFRLHIYAGQTFNNYIVKPMLVEGSTTPTEFYPYGKSKPFSLNKLSDTVKDKIVVSHTVGKNILNVLNKELTYAGIKIKIENGMVNLISGTNSARVVVDIAYLKDMPAGTYTLKQFYTPTNKCIGIIGSIFTINDDGSEQFFKYFDNCVIGVNSEVYSIPKKWRADIKVDIRNANTTVDNEKLYPMLVYGSTEPKEFEPYMLNRVYRYHATSKEHLGDLNYSSFGNNLFGYNFNQKYKFVLSTYGNVPSICSKYKQNGIVSAGTIGEKEYALGSWYFNSGSCAFIFKDSEANNNVDAIKELLKGEYLIAPLNEPYYEDITDTELGQKLLNLTPYQPYTTEFEVNNDGTIEFGYWRQIDPLPDNYTRVKALVSDGNQKITVNDIVGKNLFNPNGKREVIAYSSIKFIEADELYTATLFDKGNGSDISGIYLSISDGPVYVGHADAFSPFISNGEIKATKKNNQVGIKQLYLSVYPPNEDSWKKIFDRFNITIVKGQNGSTEFIPYISSMQNNSLEMSEPKKTLFQNKDSRVLSVDGYALKYNQICINGDFKDNTNWGGNKVINNIMTIESDADYVFVDNIIKPSAISGRKYLLLSEVYSTITTGGAGSYVDGYGSSAVISSTKINEWQLLHTFVTATTNGKFRLIPARIGLNNGNTNTVKCRKFMFIDLTDMFGAGNEPTTLDEFYTTPQGKLYRGYVEYGYHILGAGEYKSNQIIDSNSTLKRQDITNWEVSEDGRTISYIPNGYYNLIYFYPERTNHKILLCFDLLEGASPNFCFYQTLSSANYRYLTENKRYEFIGNATDRSFYLRDFVQSGFNKKVIKDLIYVDLTELGLDHLTLDELKAQRPDLFVYQPYHETETRYGLIFNDGSVYPMEKPLYGIADVKDKQSTNGVKNEKYGTVNFWELNWEYYGFAFNHHLFSIQWFGKNDDVTDRTYLLNCICNKLQQIPYTDRYDIDNLEFYITPITETNPNGIIYIAYDSDDVQAFKQTLLGIKMIYELATPTTIQTTPKSIDMDTSVTNEEYTESFTPVEQWIAKYYSGTHAVLNYIPAVRNSDLKPGMYEVATGEFKTNEGIGEFTYINDWTVNEPVNLEVNENKVEE